MANLSDLVGDTKLDSKKVMSVTAQKGRKRFWDDESDSNNPGSTDELPIELDPIAKVESESEKLLEAEFKLIKAEKKIKLLETERKKISHTEDDTFGDIASLSIRNNVKKLLFAVGEESKIQNSDWPNISTNKLRKHYKVTADSFKHCLAYGIDKKMIERKEVAYSGNVTTWCYRLLKSE